MTDRATSFGGWADDYDAWRPGYPRPAVDWLLPPDAKQVIEVGAGTGKLTADLASREVDLVVVEPDGRMLQVVRDRHPDVTTYDATASDLPLDDGSVDAVLVADAWHWFPKPEASAEVARVLRAEGWLGCVWNVPAFEHEWQWRALYLDPALAPPTDRDPLERLGLDAGIAESQAFRWTWPLTPQQWRGFASTLSHVRLLPTEQCDAALAETERLVSEQARLAGGPTVPLVHDAVCVRWWPDR